MSYLPNEDKTTGSLKVVDYAHHEIHDGSAFYFHEVIQLGSAGVQDYLITTPNTKKWSHYGYDIESTTGGITVELYEAGDRTGTTLQTVINRNRNSTNLNTTTIHKGQSGGTTDGTRIAWVTSGTATAGGKQSGDVGTTHERILKQNTKYILRITSKAASNDIGVKISWYEHTNR